jgi:hypothetical protein
MTRFISRSKFQRAIAIAAASLVLALASGSRTFAQVPEGAASDAPIPQPPSAALSQNDLANLVAPIALYPDALLSQVLVACTYPLEVVEAQQWLQQNGNFHNRELIQAAQQQNWDPSVQALVAFPDVLALLNRNVRWTTDLGNAFLAQQSDVMNAIQNLRADARQNGQLESTPQFSVNTETQGDQSAIEIQPANPQTMYVPSYNPSAVWGAPVEGSYPALPYAGSGFGSLFSTVANLAGFLPGFGGLLGPKSWGWALGWLAQTLFVNNSFFNDFGFHNSAGGSFSGGYGESSVWVHNSHHRHGVPYENSFVASSYGARQREREREGWRGTGTARQPGNGWRTFGGATRGVSAPEPRRTFAPPSSTGRESFQRNNRIDNRTDYRADNRTPRGDNGRMFNGSTRTPSAAQSARTFSQPSRTNDRGLQPNRGTGRDPYLGSSANNRTRSFEGSRPFTSSGSFASTHDAYANPKTNKSPEASRTAKSSSWAHLPHFSKARISSEYGSSQRGSSQHFSKPKHFSAPKFKAPKAPKSHGGGHSSGGHSSKRSHRG